MSHHKRRRPKHQRAGCLMCKPWKDDRGSRAKAPLMPGEQRRAQSTIAEGLADAPGPRGAAIAVRTLHDGTRVQGRHRELSGISG